MDKIIAWLLIVIGIVVIAAGFGLLAAFPIKWCWNYAVVSTFGLPAITWGKAWCLSFLASMLIKSTSTSSSKK